MKKNVDELENFVDGKKIPSVLVENKVDLLDEKEREDTEGLKGFAYDNEYDGYFRTSAKTGYNIEESMKFLIGNIIDRMAEVYSNEYNIDQNSVSLDPNKHEEINRSIRSQSKKGCC